MIRFDLNLLGQRNVEKFFKEIQTILEKIQFETREIVRTLIAATYCKSTKPRCANRSLQPENIPDRRSTRLRPRRSPWEGRPTTWCPPQCRSKRRSHRDQRADQSLKIQIISLFKTFVGLTKVITGLDNYLSVLHESLGVLRLTWQGYIDMSCQESLNIFKMPWSCLSLGLCLDRDSGLISFKLILIFNL